MSQRLTTLICGALLLGLTVPVSAENFGDPQDDPFGGGISIPLNYGQLIATMGEHNDSLGGSVFDWLSEEDSILRIGAGMFPESYQCGGHRDLAAADFNGDGMDEVVMVWSRSDGGIFVGIPTYDLVNMVPYEWHLPDPCIDSGVLYAGGGLAEILGEIRVVAGNFYPDSAMEFVLAYLAADSTVKLTVFDVDSVTLTLLEMGSISDQAVNTEVASLRQVGRLARFDVATGDFDADGLDEIVLVVDDPFQSALTDVMVDFYEYDTSAHTVEPVSKIPRVPFCSSWGSSLRRLAVVSGKFSADTTDDVAILYRWDSWDMEPNTDRVNVLHVLRFNPEMTESISEFCYHWYEVPYNPAGEVGVDGIVRAAIVYDSELTAGGQFTIAGGVDANRVASWEGSAWLPKGAGINNPVWSLIVYDGKLIAGGHFSSAGGVTAYNIAAWDGGNWSALGSGMAGSATYFCTYALAIYNGDLIAGGDYTTAGGVAANRIARWDGSSWSSLGTGMNGPVRSLTVYDGNLIAGGHFSSAGGVTAYNIAAWDGSSWSPLGSGMAGDIVDAFNVYALTVYNGDLIAGGDFTTAGGVTTPRIARWDGTQWYEMGEGFSAPVRALTVYNNELVAGGDFDYVENVPRDTVNRIARWDGSAWNSLGNGMSWSVDALTIYDDQMIAGGRFDSANGSPANHIAAWDGSDWYPILPNMEFPMGLTAAEFHPSSGGDSVAMNGVIITECRENAGNVEQYVRGYCISESVGVQMLFDTVVTESIAIGRLRDDVYAGHRTMAVADVTGDGWVDLAMLLSDNSNPTEIEVLELYPDTTANCSLDSIIEKGTWATESDNISELVLANLDTATLELRAPNYYNIDSIIQPLVILNVPPVHYDILDDTTWDVSRRYPWPPDEDYETYCAYGNRQDWATSVQSEVRKDWGISTGLKTYFSSCGATVRAHLNTEYGEGFSVQGEHTTTLSVIQAMEAQAEDMVLAASIDYDIWEYPVYRGGERLVGADVVVVDPSDVRKVWMTGKEIESWITDHEVENIFSYARYSDYVDNPMVASEGVIQGFTWPMAPSTQGYFAVRKEEFESSTVEESNNFGVEVGASLGYSGGLRFFGLGAKWGFQVSVEGSYSRSELNTYTTTFTTADSLHVQYGNINSSGSFEGNRKYEITPYAYWSKNGALVLDYAAGPIVNPQGEDPTWWQIHYSDPDPAFILPWRLDPDKEGTDPGENRYKTREIVFIPSHPSPGDTVLITARVHNFSLNPTIDTVKVSFYLGDPDNFGQLLFDKNTGDSLFWGCDADGAPTVIQSQGEVAAQMVWQVPAEGNITECQRIWALIDPMDEISPEVHDNDAEITNNKGWNRLDVNTTTDCIDRDGDGWEESAFRCCDGLGQWDNCPTIANPDQSYNPCTSCCVGITGNVDGDGGELVDVGDLTAMIAYLYIPPYPEPVCMQEGNIDGDTGGLVDIGDLTALIAYLYIPPNPQPTACQ
jgi:hypothetical protein